MRASEVSARWKTSVQSSGDDGGGKAGWMSGVLSKLLHWGGRLVSNGVKAFFCFVCWKLSFCNNLLQTSTKIDPGVWMVSARWKISKIIFEFLPLFLEINGLAWWFPLWQVLVVKYYYSIPSTEKKCRIKQAVKIWRDKQVAVCDACSTVKHPYLK